MTQITQEEIDEQLFFDREIISQLSEAGNISEIPREIFHNILFLEQRDKDAFLGAGIPDGFELTYDRYNEEEDIYDLEIVHIGTTHLDEIHWITLDLLTKIREYNGIYDGWYTSVETQ